MVPIQENSGDGKEFCKHRNVLPFVQHMGVWCIVLQDLLLNISCLWVLMVSTSLRHKSWLLWFFSQKMHNHHTFWSQETGYQLSIESWSCVWFGVRELPCFHYLVCDLVSVKMIKSWHGQKFRVATKAGFLERNEWMKTPTQWDFSHMHMFIDDFKKNFYRLYMNHEAHH